MTCLLLADVFWGQKKAREPGGCGLNPILEEIGGDRSNYSRRLIECLLFFRNNRYEFWL